MQNSRSQREYLRSEMCCAEKAHYNLLDVASSGGRILHGESQTVIRTDDVQSANCLRGLRVVFALLVDHVQLHGEFAVGIGDDGVRERAGNVPAVRLDILQWGSAYLEIEVQSARQL